MNEELTLAVDEFRQYAPGHTWLIPIRFDDGDLPEWDLGAGRTLSDLNYVNLFGEKYAEQGAALVMAVAKLMGALGPDAVTARAAVQEASDSRPPGPSSNHPDNHPAPALPKILELGGEHARALSHTQRRPGDGTRGVHWQQGGQVPHARR